MHGGQAKSSQPAHRHPTNPRPVCGLVKKAWRGVENWHTMEETNIEKLGGGDQRPKSRTLFGGQFLRSCRRLEWF